MVCALYDLQMRKDVIYKRLEKYTKEQIKSYRVV